MTVCWIKLAQGREQWRVIYVTVLNFRVLKRTALYKITYVEMFYIVTLQELF
jgi:hypothetical protein